jgi:hypothetical protein
MFQYTSIISDFRVATALSNRLQRVMQRVKCLIINVCNGATAVLRGEGGICRQLCPQPTFWVNYQGGLT